MRVSISMTNFTWPGGPEHLAEDLRAVATAADDSALDTLWVNDHLRQNDPTAAPEDHDMLEAYTVLGLLAGLTRRIHLGAMVSPVTYRAPALLLKAVTSLDVLSGGRAWLGIGAGYPGEAADFDLSMPPTAERFERLEDLLELAARMARGDERPFSGRHAHLSHPQNRPLPLRPGGIPVLLGGAGPRRTLPLVARHADACNLFDVPDDGASVRERVALLRGLCTEAGRDPAEVEVTLSSRFDPAEDADALAGRLARTRQWGVEHIVLIRAGAWTPESVRVAGDAAARLSAIG